jgi:hypothetical protein
MTVTEYLTILDFYKQLNPTESEIILLKVSDPVDVQLKKIEILEALGVSSSNAIKEIVKQVRSPIKRVRV